MADATTSATDGSSTVPSSMVRITDWYTGLGSRCFMTARLKTFDAKNSPIWTLEKFSGSEIGEYVVTASMARRRSTVPLTLVLLLVCRSDSSRSEEDAGKLHAARRGAAKYRKIRGGPRRAENACLENEQIVSFGAFALGGDPRHLTCHARRPTWPEESGVRDGHGPGRHRPASLLSSSYGAEPGGQGHRVKMESAVEVGGHRFPVNMNDEVAIVGHAQGGLGLLVGQQADSA